MYLDMISLIQFLFPMILGKNKPATKKCSILAFSFLSSFNGQQWNTNITVFYFLSCDVFITFFSKKFELCMGNRLIRADFNEKCSVKHFNFENKKNVILYSYSYDVLFHVNYHILSFYKEMVLDFNKV